MKFMGPLLDWYAQERQAFRHRGGRTLGGWLTMQAIYDLFRDAPAVAE